MGSVYSGPHACQTSDQTRPAKSQELLRFTLNEKPEQILQWMGRPDRVDDSSPVYQSWQYEWSADEANDDNSPAKWFICVRASDRQILSVTRNFDKPEDVDELFPDAQSTVHHWPSKEASQFSVRLRRLSREVLLLGMGIAKPGERTTQLVLIRRSALATFMPWLAERLE